MRPVARLRTTLTWRSGFRHPMDDTVDKGRLASDGGDGAAGVRAAEPAERYRLLFEGTPLPLILFEPDSLAIVEANAMAAPLYGCAADEFPGLTIADLTLPGQDLAAIKAPAGSYLQPQHLGPWRHRKRDGTAIEVEFTVRDVDIDGRALRFAVIQDVTGRGRAEALPRLAMQAFDNIAEGIAITDSHANIIAINTGFTRITGYSAEEVVGRNPRILQSGMQGRAFYASMWQALGERGHWRGEIVNRRKSGELYPELLSISAVRDPEGRVANYVGVFADLSERLEQEAELREMRERLELALDAGAVGTWSWQIASGRIEWDDRMCALFDLPAGKYPREYEDFLARVHETDRAHLDETVTRCVAEHIPYRAEFRVVLPDGGERILATRGSLVFDEYREPLQMIGVAWDVTERHRREAEIRELNATLDQRVQERTAELNAAMLELDAFSYSVSHDLRAPLRGLDGFSQMLLEDHAEKLDAEGREHLNRIRSASQRLSQMIDDLLQLSRVSRAQMERLPVDLSAIAREIAASLRAESPGRSVEFIIAPGLRARGDPLLLRLMMENLLGNAWKYTGKRAAGRIEFGSLPVEGERAYFVGDNGAGFDMRFVHKLFKPFERLHHAADFPGTGVGLASVARVVGRHGGRVWAQGNTGEGATFYFTLPEHPGAEPAPF